MRILLYGINYPPDLTGIGKYSGEMAEWLAARGHDVRVVTAPPYYPDWRVRADYSGVSYSREIKGGVMVYRCPLWVPERPTGLKRILHLASFALSSLPVVLYQVRWRPEVVWVVEPPLFCAPGALLAARVCNAKAWLHVQDFEVDAAFDLGLLKSGWLRHLVLAGERLLLKQFDRVSTISQRMLDRLNKKAVLGSRCYLFPNWVDTEEIAPVQRESAGQIGRNAYRNELGISEHAVVVLYSGNMGNKQGLEILAETAQMIQGQRGLKPCNQKLAAEVVFVFCGNGSGRVELEDACEGLANVIFLDLQPSERLGEFLGMADIHLLPQRADAADLVMPSKLTGMLASGRPVVATAVAGTQVAEAVAERGRVVPPGDAAALALAVAELASNPAERATLGRAARDYAVKHWNREIVLVEFEQQLSSVLE